MKFDEGIERVVIDQHNVSSSAGQLVILDFDEPSNEKDLELEDDPSVCEVTPLLPNLSLTGIRDATIQRPTETSVVPAVATTTRPPPRFSSFFCALKRFHPEQKLRKWLPLKYLWTLLRLLNRPFQQ